MANLMRKMFTEKQIGEIIKSQSQLTDINFEFNVDDNYYIFSLKLNKNYVLGQCRFVLNTEWTGRVFYSMEHEEYLSDHANYDYGETETDGENIIYKFYFNADEQASSTDKLETVRDIIIYIGK